ncbi:M48 family metalloprotease [Paraburkholderia madseniana]|uniref:M48 family metalloprotease n=1 Tax=Paraburkholderia madseniana TaxID=2599607 RepID=UPI0038BC77FD
MEPSVPIGACYYDGHTAAPHVAMLRWSEAFLSMFRSAGITLISTTLGIHLGFADVSSLAGRLVGLSYSRDMERLADANGVAYLQASGLRSDGLAAFFALTEKRSGSASGAIEFLSDHPRTLDREARNQGSPVGESALTAQQWAAVRAMCGKS